MSHKTLPQAFLCHGSQFAALWARNYCHVILYNNALIFLGWIKIKQAFHIILCILSVPMHKFENLLYISTCLQSNINVLLRSVHSHQVNRQKIVNGRISVCDACRACWTSQALFVRFDSSNQFLVSCNASQYLFGFFMNPKLKPYLVQTVQRVT